VQREELDLSSSFVFSLVNLNNAYSISDQLPRITIEMEDQEGVALQYPILPRFTKLCFFKNAIREGCLGGAAEPVFQTYESRLAEFTHKLKEFNPQKIYTIRFIFEQDTKGEIMIDDVGLTKGEE
jgi:hypothetical protein